MKKRACSLKPHRPNNDFMSNRNMHMAEIPPLMFRSKSQLLGRPRGGFIVSATGEVDATAVTHI